MPVFNKTEKDEIAYMKGVIKKLEVIISKLDEIINNNVKDHQIVAEAAMVALRPKYDFAPKKIYAYETLSETGWNIPNIQNEFIPNAYVDISEELNDKIKAMSIYKSQVSDFPNARSTETIEALAKFRGSVMNMRAAEAFMLIRELK